LIRVNPFKLLMWTFRRSPADVIDLYNTLSPVMQLATGGSMLNFGFWEGISDGPLAAQRRLCDLAGELAELDSGTRLIDVGSGLGAPASHWISSHGNLEAVACLNLNRKQLRDAVVLSQDASRRGGHLRVNATSVMLPVPANSYDRIIALESAQHFRPLADFASECRRALMPGGIMVLAVPVTDRPLRGLDKLLRLGILSLTWSSEHYSAEHVISALEKSGFKILETRRIGRHVYEPLSSYYLRNRESIRQKIVAQYPAFVESVLFRSILKMRKASEAGLIDYLIIKAA
jgi:cyclopropane fatty-acyl-phospholipid synthase-like methyltransferase